MKNPLDFDVASNPHNALLASEEPDHDHPPYSFWVALSPPLPPRRCPPWFAPRPGRTVKIKTRDGIELFVKDTGGAGRAVVMTHAWPLNADIWDYQAAALSKRRLCA